MRVCFQRALRGSSDLKQKIITDENREKIKIAREVKALTQKHVGV